MIKILLLKRKQISPNIQKFIDLLDEHERKENKKPRMERNIFPPATSPQLVVDCLCDVFLGEDWYTPNPITTGQVNTVILDTILYRYCREYRKDADRKAKERRKQ